jgi:hypothetical protein
LSVLVKKSTREKFSSLLTFYARMSTLPSLPISFQNQNRMLFTNDFNLAY